MKETSIGDSETALAKSSGVSEISPGLLAELFESLEEAVLVADRNRRLVYVNLAAERLFGYRKDELYGKETKVLYADEGDFSEQGRKRFNAASNIATENFRVVYRRSDGEQFLGMTTGSAMRSADGAVTGFIGVVRPAHSADRSLDALQRVHTITSDINMTHNQKISSLMRVVLNHFGLEIAILSRIIENDYIVEDCVDLIGDLKPLTKFEVSGTYCSHTLNADKTVGFHYVGKSEIRNHPCYKNFQLESYIGAPVKLNGDIYGTINFSSPSPVEPFNKDDHILVELVSDAISYLLYKKMADEELEALARVDELTGLPNRRATLERLNQLIDQSNRFTKDLSVLSIDIDHFKKINDKWGHAAGDRALVEFGQVVSGLGRKTDFCGRIGGEEFVFVLSGADSGTAQALGDKLRHLLAATPVDLNGGESISLSVSAGVAMLENGESVESLLARADDAMYRAKQQGRDRVCQ
ncbi:MAG: diguanylate cyclase [Gammaproteobacteria bacterium]|nr:diguanylate cyclase [Gammaproteobacteria bacterium]